MRLSEIEAKWLTDRNIVLSNHLAPGGREFRVDWLIDTATDETYQLFRQGMRYRKADAPRNCEITSFGEWRPVEPA